MALFGTESSTWTSLRRQVLRQLAAARENALPNGTVPRVGVDFKQGVSQAVADELRRMGVVVRGQVITEFGETVPFVPPPVAPAAEEPEEVQP